MQNQSRLIPITDWNQFHPWPPIGGMRHLRFHQSAKGFESAFIKVGRRVLIDEAKFFECIKNQGGGSDA